MLSASPLPSSSPANFPLLSSCTISSITYNMKRINLNDFGFFVGYKGWKSTSENDNKFAETTFY